MKAKCDNLWQKIVKRSGRCAKCGRTGDIDAHHIISKGAYPKYRHKPVNGVPLCRWCHSWAHRCMEAFLNWLEAKRPKQHEWYLLALNDKRFVKIDYTEEYERLKDYERSSTSRNKD